MCGMLFKILNSVIVDQAKHAVSALLTRSTGVLRLHQKQILQNDSKIPRRKIVIKFQCSLRPKCLNLCAY